MKRVKMTHWGFTGGYLEEFLAGHRKFLEAVLVAARIGLMAFSLYAKLTYLSSYPALGKKVNKHIPTC